MLLRDSHPSLRLAALRFWFELFGGKKAKRPSQRAVVDRLGKALDDKERGIRQKAALLLSAHMFEKKLVSAPLLQAVPISATAYQN